MKLLPASITTLPCTMGHLNAGTMTSPYAVVPLYLKQKPLGDIFSWGTLLFQFFYIILFKFSSQVHWRSFELSYLKSFGDMNIFSLTVSVMETVWILCVVFLAHRPLLEFPTLITLLQRIIECCGFRIRSNDTRLFPPPTFAPPHSGVSTHKSQMDKIYSFTSQSFKLGYL